MAQDGTDRSVGPIPVKAAFVGFAEWGPCNEPVTVSTWEAFAETFGDRSDLAWAARGWFDNGGTECVIVRLFHDQDLTGREILGAGTDYGLGTLDAVGDVDVVACPSLVRLTGADSELWVALQGELVAACERSGERLALLETPPAMNPGQCRDWRVYAFDVASPFAVLYYPWVRVMDGERTVTVPPCGHIAGVWAAVAQDGDLTTAAANVRLQGVVDVETVLVPLDLDRLYALGINPIVARAGWGARPWGTRSTSDDHALSNLGRARLLARLSRELESPEKATEDTVRATWTRLTRRLSGQVTVRLVRGKSSDARKDVDIELEDGYGALFTWVEPGRWVWSVHSLTAERVLPTA